MSVAQLPNSALGCVGCHRLPGHWPPPPVPDYLSSSRRVFRIKCRSLAKAAAEPARGKEVQYDAGQKAMVLTWEAPHRAVKHYVIYRSRNGSAPSTIGSAAQTATTYMDRDYPGEGSYVYFLKAMFADGTASPVAQSAVMLAP